MPQLAEQFEKAKANVNPTPADVSNASDAHVQVRQALESSDHLKELGVDTVLIGSYSRHVAIKRIKDVDVFSKLPEVDITANPRSLLHLFRDVLEEAFGEDRIELQERSLKVDFPSFNLTVDAVPAAPWGPYWRIPDRDSGWRETNPEGLGALTTAANEEHDGNYVPTVKLIRQARRAQLGDEQPGGFFIEIATYHAFASGMIASSSTEYFCEALAGVSTQLYQSLTHGLADPALPGGVISTRATVADLERAIELFKDLAARGRKALSSTDACGAAYEFRRILGKTTDGRWVFPLPSYCNDDGTPKSTASGIRPGSVRVPEGDRFA